MVGWFQGEVSDIPTVIPAYPPAESAGSVSTAGDEQLGRYPLPPPVLRFLRELAEDSDNASAAPQPLLPSTESVDLDSHCEVRGGVALLRTELGCALSAESVDVGVRHRCEAILGSWLAQFGEDAESWISTLVGNEPAPFVSGLLICLGRLPRPGSDSWRRAIVQEGLKSGSSEVRDASVRAIEQWNGVELLDVLRTHEEPVSWLRDYVQGVIDDLEQ